MDEFKDTKPTKQELEKLEEEQKNQPKDRSMLRLGLCVLMVVVGLPVALIFGGAYGAGIWAVVLVLLLLIFR